MEKKIANRTRNKEVKFRLTEKELENLNEKISKSKMSKQKFFEKLITEKEILVIDDLPKLILELNRIGINLNQLTKKINSEEKLGVFKKIDLNKDLKTNSDALKSILSTLKDIFNIN
ncbi:plasmid mobilization relaxosome protein MobC [Cetobacterium somerae]|uniref:plasmid mobilization protein n=1 Tax=Cetobacterium somerae TaxID=188913 RepID=UPI00211E7695|nr:plasmid mobilization relaxosome protein MobC [Cetobacterium somerae]MCQ9628406.1 plasmid mobilization relaxosome protein MobC [Cetobacterium somerae]